MRIYFRRFGARLKAKLLPLRYSFICGPVDCKSSSQICIDHQGKVARLKEAAKLFIPLPSSSQPSLIELLTRYSAVYSPPVDKFQIPEGRIYINDTILSPSCLAIARDVSVVFSDDTNWHPLLGRSIFRGRRIAGQCLSIASAGSRSYYHWLFDELPRLLVYEHINIDYLHISKPFGFRLNVLKQICNNNHINYKKIVWLRSGQEHFQFDQLLYSSYIAPTGQPTPFVIELLQAMGEQIAPSHLQASAKLMPQKIIIGRRSLDGRQLVGIKTILPKLFSMGFNLIYLEDLGFTDQIRLFRSARQIVSPHGAGLSNLVFCKSSPLVVEIFNNRYVHWCNWITACLVNATYRPIYTPFVENCDHNQAFGKDAILMPPIDDLLNLLR